MKKKLLLSALGTLALASCFNRGPIIPNIPDYVDPDVYDEASLRDPGEEPFTYDNNISVASEAADPFVYRFNGKYYLYTTTGGGYIRGYVSDDLLIWTPVDNGVSGKGFVYNYNSDSGHPDSNVPYAPEMTYFNGYFYMTASPLGKGHYIFRAESPEGPFEAITGNFGKSIDGSFFIDDNEKIYFLTAGPGNIQLFELNDDFASFKKVEGNDFQVSIEQARMGGWNEGPYITKRYGKYYLTFTGTNYIDREYRVNYCYADELSDIRKGRAFTQENTILLNTEETNFFALGHSANVLGPDLDSTLISYHNMIPGGRRNYSIGRLSFNGSNMVVNGDNIKDNVGWEGPVFEASGLYDIPTTSEGYFLSDVNSGSKFSAEFTLRGEGKMVFSYVDNKNYGYVEYKSNKIGVYQVEDGKNKKIDSTTLIHSFDPDVWHTFRIQYARERINVYYDSMCKIEEAYCHFEGGQIGIMDDTFEEVGYVAMSNYAFGSSDAYHYADKVSLANGYLPSGTKLGEGSGLVKEENHDSYNYQQKDNVNLVLKNEGDIATYRMFAHSDGFHHIELRVPSSYSGKEIGVRIDGGSVQNAIIGQGDEPYSKDGDILVSIGEFDLDRGCHNISLVNIGDEVAFSEIRYEQSLESKELNVTFDASFNVGSSDFRYKNEMEATSAGLKSVSYEPFQAYLSKTKFRNPEIHLKMKVNSFEVEGFAGLLFNGNNFSASEANYVGSLQGYGLVAVDGGFAIKQFNYGLSKDLKRFKATYSKGVQFDLGIEINNNVWLIYLNNKLIETFVANIGDLQGGVGFATSACAAEFRSIEAFD